MTIANQRNRLHSLAVCVVLGVLSTTAVAQQTPQAMAPAQKKEASKIDRVDDNQDASATSPANEQAQASKLTGRLPRYFAKVVDNEQRREIYRIQAEYVGKIEALEKQLEALRRAEMQAIVEVLSKEQWQQIQQLRELALARLAARQTDTP